MRMPFNMLMSQLNATTATPLLPQHGQSRLLGASIGSWKAFATDKSEVLDSFGLQNLT